jgi:t-SNARE complex subunit (syntaxin)
VEIADNTETAKENVSKALDQVKQADERKRYCACGRTKMICYIIFAVVILLMLLGIIVAVA